ncbi:MAG TPA: ATP-dependent DNA ligase [Labilithrix sp.]
MVRPPVAPMLAKLERSLRPGFVYEPKWDGFRALAFVERGRVDLRSRNDKRLARYFPELAESLAAFGDIVLDGEIVVLGANGALDFAALMARLHPAESRVERLRGETPAVFVAFDLLGSGDEDLRARPFVERRAELERALASAPSNVLVTPATRDLERARRWLERFRGGGLDGVVAKDPSAPYSAGRRTMIKVKHARTCECVVAGFRVLRDEPKVSSVLLGLYDGDRVVHVGVVSQLAADARRALFDVLARDVVPLAGHPWEHGFGLERSPLGRLKGAAGRWDPTEMERDWNPLRPHRVWEVAYDTLDDARFRHPARLVRERPDRDPRSCTFDQLPEAPPDLRAMLAS